MKTTLKSVMAVAALVAASSAVAQVVVPPQPAPSIGPVQPANSGGLYVTIWNPTTQVSLVEYLGLTLDQVLEPAMTPDAGLVLNFGTIQGFTATFGTDVSNLRYHVTAVDSSGGAAARRAVTTADQALGTTFGIDAGSVQVISNAGRDFFLSLQAACGASSPGGLRNPCSSTASGFYAGTQLWGDQLGGGLPVNAYGLVGTALQFYFLQGVTDIGEIVNAALYQNANGVGQWLLSAGGQLTYSISAIPLPAAVWLLLSGLVGLGAVARRKRAAAAA